MLISIIIPTKNRCDLLRETLASVMAQTHVDWEAIVVDDGSIDGTEEMMSEMAVKDLRVRFLCREKRRSGAAACRNLGVAASNGEYVIFLDSDDLLAPGCLERRLKVMQEDTKLDFAVFLTRIFRSTPGDGTFLINNFTQEDDLDRFLRQDVPWQTTGPIWRKASLSKIGPWDEKALTMQDCEFHIRALAARLNYRKVPEVDSFWRMMGPASMTHEAYWASPRRVWNRIRLYVRLIAILRAKGLLTERRRRLQAAEYYRHAFVINRSRRLAYKIWTVARREKMISPFEFVVVLISDMILRSARKLHESTVTRLLPETRLKRTHFVALPPVKHE
jgi:glycosyltransferase involved in cell wall biosynthesis